MPLLLDAGKLGVALIHDHVEQSVTHLLCRNLAQIFPLTAAPEMAELDFLSFDRAKEGIEFEFGYFVAIDANFLAPLVE